MRLGRGVARETASWRAAHASCISASSTRSGAQEYATMRRPLTGCRPAWLLGASRPPAGQICIDISSSACGMAGSTTAQQPVASSRKATSGACQYLALVGSSPLEETTGKRKTASHARSRLSVRPRNGPMSQTRSSQWHPPRSPALPPQPMGTSRASGPGMEFRSVGSRQQPPAAWSESPPPSPGSALRHKRRVSCSSSDVIASAYMHIHHSLPRFSFVRAPYIFRRHQGSRSMQGFPSGRAPGRRRLIGPWTTHVSSLTQKHPFPCACVVGSRLRLSLSLCFLAITTVSVVFFPSFSFAAAMYACTAFWIKRRCPFLSRSAGMAQPTHGSPHTPHTCSRKKNKGGGGGGEGKEAKGLVSERASAATNGIPCASSVIPSPSCQM